MNTPCIETPIVAQAASLLYRRPLACWSVRRPIRSEILTRALTLLTIFLALSPLAAQPSPLIFIDTSIENASPLWYDLDPHDTNVIRIHLLYDHERSSSNRAAGHIHFRVHAKPQSQLTFEFINLDNVWNSRPGSIARELKSVVVSEDGQQWKSIPTETLPTNRIRLHLTMPGPRLDIARAEPYRLSDLQEFLTEISASPFVQIRPIGKTVQGRPLEIIRIADPNANAPYRVFLRARAHPWEPVGNWLVEGLADRLLRNDVDAKKKFLARYTVYIMPMANKDGVALGRTRFNLLGEDLNRNWDQPADPQLAPENAALENWLEEMISAGQKPHLALELHNDGSGRLHISRPPIPAPDLDRHLKRMTTFEDLLRKHTWFTEGRTESTFRNSGTLGEGWLMRYGIDAAVHEFNCNWIAGLNDYPSAKHWKTYGANLATVFFDYFEAVKP